MMFSKDLSIKMLYFLGISDTDSKNGDVDIFIRLLTDSLVICET
jgi:hypothetical protein